MFNLRKSETNLKALDLLKEIAQNMEAKAYLTVTETCDLLGISRTHLYGIRKSGKLRHTPIGRKKIVFLRSDIDAFVMKQREDFDPEPSLIISGDLPKDPRDSPSFCSYLEAL